MKEIKNSKNTENPYELIAGVELYSRKRKKFKLKIIGTEYKTDPSNSSFLYVSKFKVSDLPEMKYDDELQIMELYSKIQSFTNKCINPLEIITIFIDAYKANKKLLGINFKTIPVYGDAIDSKFIYNELIG